MYKNIKTALEYLPEKFVTQEIVDEATKCKDVAVLSHIPQRFLTIELIERVIADSDKSWHSFNLKNIPVECRTEPICAYAVQKEWRNIHSVPADIITRDMALKVVLNSAGDLDILSAIPAHIWDTELAIEAMVSQVGRTYRIGDYNGAIMRLEVVLGYLPASLKTQDLFIAMLQRENIEVLCTERVAPAKFKNKRYYQYVAKRDLSMVPKKYISYETLYAALFSEYSNNHVCSEYMFRDYIHLLDDRLADQLIRKHAYLYRRLPDEFRTSKRLILALESGKNDGNDFIDIEKSKDRRLLTTEVCRAYERRGGSCPKFPDRVWTKRFVSTARQTANLIVGSSRCHGSSRHQRIRRRHSSITPTTHATLPSDLLHPRWQRESIERTITVAGYLSTLSPNLRSRLVSRRSSTVVSVHCSPSKTTTRITPTARLATLTPVSTTPISITPTLHA